MDEKNYTEVDPEYLNNSVWATLAPSKIRGIGVFAIRDIKKGTRLGLQGGSGEWIKCDLTKVVPEVRKLVCQRWPMEKDGYPFLSPNDDALMVSFINHSDKPCYNKYSDTASRDIKKGEEITVNYGDYKDIIKIK